MKQRFPEKIGASISERSDIRSVAYQQRKRSLGMADWGSSDSNRVKVSKNFDVPSDSLALAGPCSNFSGKNQCLESTWDTDRIRLDFN